MSVGVKKRPILFALCAMLISEAAPLSIFAQCSMCKANVQAGASATNVAGTLNLAILVLLIPPVLIFCAIFFVALRYRRGMEDRGVDALNARSF